MPPILAERQPKRCSGAMKRTSPPGTAAEEYVFQAFDVGAFHYLVKPFSDEKFKEVDKGSP